MKIKINLAEIPCQQDKYDKCGPIQTHMHENKSPDLIILYVKGGISGTNICKKLVLPYQIACVGYLFLAPDINFRLMHTLEAIMTIQVVEFLPPTWEAFLSFWLIPYLI